MTTNLIAMPHSESSLLGAIVFWALSGGLDLERLREAWEDADLDPKHLPEAPSPEVAFSRACKQLRDNRRLVRPLADGGWGIVQEKAAKDDLTYHVGLKVHLDQLKRIVGDPDDHPDLELIRTNYERFSDSLIQQDVSSWLSHTVSRLEAVPLRGTGGVYFVPAHTYTEWLRVKACVTVATAHTCHNIPAARTDDAIEAALDAIRNEVASSVERLAEEVEGHHKAKAEGVKKGTFGKRAFQTKISTAEGVEAKLARYESLLGRALPELHADLHKIRANMVAAMLSGGSDD